jgi:hypothetical protein
MWKEKADLTDLPLFGANMMTFIPKEKRNKLMKNCDNSKVFVGYEGRSKNFRMLDPKKGTIQIVKKAVARQESSTAGDSDNEVQDVGSCSKAIEAVPSSSGSDDESDDDSSAITITDTEEDDSDSDTSEQSESEYEPSTESNHSNENLNDNDQVDDTFVEANDDLDGSGNTYADDVENDPDFDPRENNALATPSAVNQKSRKTRPFQLYANLAAQSECERALKCDTRFHDEDPQTLAEIMRRHDKQEWLAARQSEYDSLMENNTWILVEMPKDAKMISTKMLYKTKYDNNGNAVRRKARLVARGFTQRKGIDYKETYAPVVKYTSIRVLMAIAAKRGLNVHQLDVTTAFLHGELEEEIFIAQPEGFEDGTNRVCRLLKSLYGLKQAPKNWNRTLDQKLKSFGLIQCKEDPCIYYSKSMKTFIAIYVDDFLIFYENRDQFEIIKEVLMNSFDMKDLGEAKGCLGIRIALKKGKIELDQEIYLKEVLERFNMADCKPVSTPVQTGSMLTKSSDEAEIDRNDIPYQEAIGCLLYLARGTRPDIAFAVNLVSRFNNCFKQSHWTAVKRIMRYLNGTRTRKLQYTAGGLLGFVDADWGASVERKSTTGYVFLLAGGAISWKSQQQNTIATSSTTAELYAAYEAIIEAIWLKKLLVELREMGEKYSVPILCDNSGVISTFNNKNFSNKLKHVDTKYHFVISDEVKKNIFLKKVDTKLNAADYLTKAVPSEKHIFCASENGLTIIKI